MSKIGKRVCVVGAGVIGLSTAVRLLDVAPSLQVTVVADLFTPFTTSDGAAGVNVFWNYQPDSLLYKWGFSTYMYGQKLYKENGHLTGVQQFFTVDIYDKETNCINASDIDRRKLSYKELEALYPGSGYRYGTSSLTYLTECKIYLPWLMKRFKLKGGNVLHRHVNSFDEIAADYDVIVNCSGLGARQLAHDDSIKPVRGQIFRVKAPWIKIATYDHDKMTYIFPRSNDVIVGGVYQHDNWDLSINHQDRENIWKRACKMDPSLKHAHIINEWVGLRPGRPEVRLEREVIVVNGKKVNVVHNYGHSSRGITLHWGCAVDASQLVLQCLQLNTVQSRL
ncbi:D-aspartate oxidase-like [Antedon mediterranea]|uniref:D-aspartate oxidase-like n=1 Tax=Antedon mediterranea TaxID=105859 RepID=UPI003AF5402A